MGSLCDRHQRQHKKSKKVVSKALAGVTGDLLMFRQQGLEASEDVCKLWISLFSPAWLALDIAPD